MSVLPTMVMSAAVENSAYQSGTTTEEGKLVGSDEILKTATKHKTHMPRSALLAKKMTSVSCWKSSIDTSPAKESWYQGVTGLPCHT